MDNGVSAFSPQLNMWKKNELILFFVLLPLLLIIILSLPNETRRYFILDLKNPTFLSIFANHYTHSEPYHLLNNLSMYFLALFAIFNVETDKKRFYWIMATLFIALPIVSSLIIILYLTFLPPLQGFSAIASGLVGYTIYTVYSYLKQNYDFVKPTLFSLILMINFLMLVITNKYGLSYVFITGVVTTAFLAMSYNDILALINEGREYLKNQVKGINFKFVYILFVFAVCLILSFALPFIVPLEIVNNGTITNIISHYLGWAWGFFVPWLYYGITVIARWLVPKFMRCSIVSVG